MVWDGVNGVRFGEWHAMHVDPEIALFKDILLADDIKDLDTPAASDPTKPVKPSKYSAIELKEAKERTYPKSSKLKDRLDMLCKRVKLVPT